MRRVDGASALVAAALCASLATPAPHAAPRSPALELHGPGADLHLDLDGRGRIRIGIDGLVEASPHTRHAYMGPVIGLRIADSVALASALPAAGAEPNLHRAAPPCSVSEYSHERSPGTMYDFMLFGDAANQPWVRLRCRDTSGWARLPDLPLRKVDSGRSIPFTDPAILRSPFLEPLLQAPLVPESGHPVRTYRWSEASPALALFDSDSKSGSKADSLSLSFSGWNWSIVHDDSHGGRQRVDSRNTSGGRPIWILAWGKPGRVVSFEEGYRREPRRVDSFVASRSGKTYLVFEVATLFGDGIWTDLWVAGPDTLWTRRIGERNGESGTDTKAEWRISPRAGTVSVSQAGRFKTVFRAP